MSEVLQQAHQQGIIFFPYAIIIVSFVAAFLLKDNEHLGPYLFQLIAMGVLLSVLLFLSNKNLIDAQQFMNAIWAIIGYTFGTSTAARQARAGAKK